MDALRHVRWGRMALVAVVFLAGAVVFSLTDSRLDQGLTLGSSAAVTALILRSVGSRPA